METLTTFALFLEGWNLQPDEREQMLAFVEGVRDILESATIDTLMDTYKRVEQVFREEVSQHGRQGFINFAIGSVVLAGPYEGYNVEIYNIILLSAVRIWRGILQDVLSYPDIPAFKRELVEISERMRGTDWVKERPFHGIAVSLLLDDARREVLSARKEVEDRRVFQELDALKNRGGVDENLGIDSDSDRPIEAVLAFIEDTFGGEYFKINISVEQARKLAIITGFNPESIRVTHARMKENGSCSDSAAELVDRWKKECRSKARGRPSKSSGSEIL